MLCKLSFYTGALQLKDHDYLRLQFLGAKKAWLGCPYDICDLRRCPSAGDNYRHFDTQCGGETFQIFNNGTQNSAIKCGQRIRLHYLLKENSWVGCPMTKKYCDKSNCPGTTSNAKNFNRCGGEIFIIYARGRNNGEVIYNGDVVMLYYPSACKYISIQGEVDGNGSSLSFCPGLAPPAYLSYGVCSKNAFRIYRKP